jgi:hypothetical protein
VHRAIASFLRYGLLLLVYGVVAAFLLDCFMGIWGFRGDSRRYGIEALLGNRSHRPFAYRVLSPAVVNAGVRLMPERLRTERRTWLLEGSPLLRYRFESESWSVEKSVRWHVAYAYVFASLLAMLFAVRWLTGRVYPDRELFRDYAPALGALLLPLSFHLGGYLYDFADLGFLALATGALLRPTSWLYYPVFVLAVLNKESAVLLLALFLAVHWGAMPARRLATHAACQALVGAALLAGVRALVRDHPGGPVEVWIGHNLRYWTDPSSYVATFSPIAPFVRLPQPGNAASLALLAAALAWRWSEKPTAVRRLVVASLATTVPLLLLFALENEIRGALYLAFPPIYLAACHSVLVLYGGASQPVRS